MQNRTASAGRTGSRLVIVSNRTPDLSKSARAGGLENAVLDALNMPVLWCGWSGKISADPTLKTLDLGSDRGQAMTFDLPEDLYKNFYLGFSNRTLWPVLHFRPGLLEFERSEYQAYLAANDRFADALHSVLRPDDLIWVHDYHLIGLATALRRRGALNRIGFFLHVPFVPPALWRILPVARDLLTMLCHYDVLGFQTETDTRAFERCIEILLGEKPSGRTFKLIGGRTTRLVTAPAGINPRRVMQSAKRAARSKPVRRLVDSLVGRALIAGAERLDYTKGLIQRVEAFRRLLERNPNQRQKISFLQVAAVSRVDIPDYQSLKQELDRSVGRINGQFGEIDWVPFRYLTRPVPRNTLSGILRVARVGVVTPFRDGMNLVAKEFVAAQDPADPGVLILSEFAGAAEDLTEALVVNPFDADQLADALKSALTMPLDERVERHAALLRKVYARDADAHFQSMFSAIQVA